MVSTTTLIPESPLPPPHKRRTMVKNVVGKVKTKIFLPEHDFVFGISNKMDEEGAGKVVQSWAQSEPSKPHESLRSFPATNREALKHGCLTAKAQHRFAKETPVMKQNPKSLIKQPSQNITVDFENRSFGIKTIKNKVSISDLLKGPPSEDDIELIKQNNFVPMSQKKGRMPPARSTKSSRLLHSIILPPSEEEMAVKRAKEEFKMKKFLKVDSKVNLMRQ